MSVIAQHTCFCMHTNICACVIVHACVSCAMCVCGLLLWICQLYEIPTGNSKSHCTDHKPPQVNLSTTGKHSWPTQSQSSGSGSTNWPLWWLLPPKLTLTHAQIQMDNTCWILMTDNTDPSTPMRFHVTLPQTFLQPVKAKPQPPQSQMSQGQSSSVLPSLSSHCIHSLWRLTDIRSQ